MRRRYQKGDRFHFFTLLEEAPARVSVSGRKYCQWKCVCDCGKEFVTTTKQIRRGSRKSCGCRSESGRFKTLNTDTQAVYAKVLSHYRQAAKRRNLEFSLTADEFVRLLNGNCHYCGVPPCRQVGKYAGPRRLEENPNLSETTVNGIDRVDSDKGYLSDNTVTCCHICNRAKREMTQEAFLIWIDRLVAFRWRGE